MMIAAGAVVLVAAVAVTLAVVVRGRTPDYDITSRPTALYEITGPKSARLKGPLGVAVHRGRLYVTDSGNARILVFRLDGRLVSSIGVSPAEKGDRRTKRRPLTYPVGVAVSSAGDVYVADVKGGGVRVFSPDGRPIKTIRPPKGTFRPLGLTFDQEGRLYVADGAGGRVLVFDRKGTLLEGLAQGELDYPNGIAFDGNELLVADSNNGRILRFADARGKPNRVDWAGAGERRTLLLPRGIAVDTKGRLYVSDTLNHTVYIADRRGKIIAAFG